MPEFLSKLFSQGDRARRHVLSVLRDPMGALEQMSGALQDAHRENVYLSDMAFGDKTRPFKVTDQDALQELAQRALSGPLSMAPVGMVGNSLSQQVEELMPYIMQIPKGQRVGIRMLPDDVPTPSVGDTLSPSWKWIDGVRTDSPLYGTSAMDVSTRSREEVEAALRLLGVMNNAGKGYYPGNKLAVISGASKRKGQDRGEVMIKDAIVHYLTDPPLGPR